MKLVQVKGKSKKTGKDYVAYSFYIGDFHSPLFFPSDIELNYLKQVCEDEGIEYVSA